MREREWFRITHMGEAAVPGPAVGSDGRIAYVVTGNAAVIEAAVGEVE